MFNIFRSKSSNRIWKVHGEDRYFKRLDNNDWAEFANGRQVYQFKFVRSYDDVVILKKTDGSYYKLDSSKLQIGWSEDSFNVEQSGTWVSESALNQPRQCILYAFVNF